MLRTLELSIFFHY